MNRVIEGVVIHGKGKGKTFGFPTANIEYEKKYEDIAKGVYASYVYIGNERYIGITNIGDRPSVDSDSKFTIETHILGFSKDIYGEQISICLKSYLRPTAAFCTIEDLKEQLKIDSTTALSIL